MTARKLPIAQLGTMRQIPFAPKNFDAALKYRVETVGVGPFSSFDDGGRVADFANSSGVAG